MGLKDIVLHEMSDIEKTNIVCYCLYVEGKKISMILIKVWKEKLKPLSISDSLSAFQYETVKIHF